VPPKINSKFFLQQPNLIGPSLNKMKLWGLPKTEGSILKYSVPPLCLTYIAERRTPFAKACGIKLRCYGEHIENLGNILGTWWEHIGNSKGTHCEPGKNEKGKKARHFECMLEPSHWLHELSRPKRVRHHFWPGLIPIAKNTLSTWILVLFHIN